MAGCAPGSELPPGPGIALNASGSRSSAGAAGSGPAARRATLPDRVITLAAERSAVARKVRLGSVPVDQSVPNIARIYDYLLGGKDNFAADRRAARAIQKTRPDVADLLLDNKQFMSRAVPFVAGQGIEQFIDIGSGLPTSAIRQLEAPPLWLSTHEAARTVAPGAKVVYVD